MLMFECAIDYNGKGRYLCRMKYTLILVILLVLAGCRKEQKQLCIFETVQYDVGSKGELLIIDTYRLNALFSCQDCEDRRRLELQWLSQYKPVIDTKTNKLVDPAKYVTCTPAL